MRVFDEVQHFDVIELNVEVLIDRLEGASNANIVLKLNGDRLVGQGLEETARELACVCPDFRYNSTPEEKHGCVGWESLSLEGER